MKDIFHVTKDHYPCAGCNQGIPAFTQTTGEEEEKRETSHVLGTAQEHGHDHPRGGEDCERGQKPGEGHREEAC